MKMRLLKLLLAGAAVGVIVIAFRDFDQGKWIAPPLGVPGEDGDEAEPILGYDGMDVDALLDWFDQTGPDSAMLQRMRDYEAAHLAREAVLGAIGERL
jgi:hypothetical protein